MADIASYSPQSGLMIGADGRAYNIVDLYGGGTPVNDQVYEISHYPPIGGIVIGSDGRAYDIIQVIQGKAVSAYELAVASGFVGTLTQWLASLKGAKGDKGDYAAEAAETLRVAAEAQRVTAENTRQSQENARQANTATAITNANTATATANAAAEQITTFQTQITEKTGYGVVSGLTVSAQANPNMTVAVPTGIIYLSNGTRLVVAAVAALGVNAAHATYARTDIVYVSVSGITSYLAGTAAATPVAPSVPSGGLLLAEIAVAAGATAITSNMIANKARTLWTEAPIKPTLVNGATHQSPTNDPVEYIRDITGQVRLRGRVAGITTDAAAFSLASGYRPLRTTLFYGNDATGKVIVGYVSISGTVFLYASVGYASYISLSGITFQTTV